MTEQFPTASDLVETRRKYPLIRSVARVALAARMKEIAAGKFAGAQSERVAKRAIGQASINSEDLRSIQLILPPLAEQNRIAALLNEQIIQAKCLQKELEERSGVINNLPSALLRQAFAGRL